VTGSAEGGEFTAAPPAAGRGAWTEPGTFEVAPGVHRIPVWERPDDWIAAGEVARVLTWTRRDRTLDELDSYNQMLAVLETAAHLDLLVMQGRLSSTQDGDVTKYWAP
jgi:hypothetical protein